MSWSVLGGVRVDIECPGGGGDEASPVVRDIGPCDGASFMAPPDLPLHRQRPARARAPRARATQAAPPPPPPPRGGGGGRGAPSVEDPVRVVVAPVDRERVARAS